MDLGIHGKLSLVTGSTAGIGFATPRALAEEGARVTMNGRTTARNDSLWHDQDRTNRGCARAGRIAGGNGYYREQRAARAHRFFATARPSSIIQRFATPDEVASMIAYVCSARASATTGAAFRVDGGVVRAII
jgi:NAD(P)-dependent dehydrogenase (short-subunit alcohol dehydrogenase family)